MSKRRRPRKVRIHAAIKGNLALLANSLCELVPLCMAEDKKMNAGRMNKILLDELYGDWIQKKLLLIHRVVKVREYRTPH